jgi:hypothetical protein
MKNEECGNRIDHNRARVCRRTIRHSSFVLLFALTLLLPALTFAESPNRWLLIFDTSSSMHSRTKGTEDMLQDMLITGMHGQLHHGDTIGIWTFSDKLHAGEAPLQIWSPEMSQMIARHTLQYLENQRYGKSANLQAVLTNVYPVVDSSDFITVILFSDGDQAIKGTPFDDEINQRYKDNYKQQKKASMPIITVLQAKHGSFTTNTVNFGPWPIDIPAVPPPPAPKRPVEPQAAPKPAPEMGPPIIFDGRKTQSAAPENTTVLTNNPAELAPTAVIQPTVTATPTETQSTTQPATTTQPAPPPALSEAPPPASAPAVPATPPPTEVAAKNQPESKRAAAPATPPAANQPEPPASSPTEAHGNPATTPPPVETATTVASSNLLSPRNVAIVSVTFAALVCGLLLLAARNARKNQASLITRSLDREQR